ncbi:hypothetical protein IC582_016707 [Cucumis melo]
MFKLQWVIATLACLTFCIGDNVSYDSNAIIINEQRRIIFSGSIHYPRSTEAMWPLIQDAGLYVVTRIGPYVCAEWNYGGFPMWLHNMPGIQLRTNNQVYKNEMQTFTTKIVNMCKQANLFASQGGPIILA